MIHFHTQDLKFTLKNKTLLKAWILSTIQKKKRESGQLNYIFCSDAFLLQINKQYLNHDTYTDIITFDYTIENKRGAVSGDIYISIERVIENAGTFSKTVEDELLRVMIHGTLHLLGYKDKTKTDKATMRKQEDACLKQLGKIKKE